MARLQRANPADNLGSITNNLYASSTISGTPVSTFSKIASVANNTFITGTFDGMAFGWRETGSVASSMNVNSARRRSWATLTRTMW